MLIIKYIRQMGFNKYIIVFGLAFFFLSCKAQKNEWQTFTIKNKLDGFLNGRIVDHGETWKVYKNESITFFVYRDTIPTILSTSIERKEIDKSTFKSYVNEFFVNFSSNKKCFKLTQNDNILNKQKVTFDSLKSQVVVFSTLPFIIEENKKINTIVQGDTISDLFSTQYKPDNSYPDSTYLIRIPAVKYLLSFPLFPALDNDTLKTIGYKMIYNPTVIEGHNIPRREFSTILYPGPKVVPPEIEKIYADFKTENK